LKYCYIVLIGFVILYIWCVRILIQIITIIINKWLKVVWNGNCGNMVFMLNIYSHIIGNIRNKESWRMVNEYIGRFFMYQSILIFWNSRKGPMDLAMIQIRQLKMVPTSYKLWIYGLLYGNNANISIKIH
jgi:hypothetical protein